MHRHLSFVEFVDLQEISMCCTVCHIYSFYFMNLILILLSSVDATIERIEDSFIYVIFYCKLYINPIQGCLAFNPLMIRGLTILKSY